MLFKNTTPELFSPYPPLLPTPTPNSFNNSTYHSKPVNTGSSTAPFSNRFSNNTTTQSNPTIQKLSPQSQIQAKRKKGLCFYCDDKYTVGHKCKASAHVLIVPDYEDFGVEDGSEAISLEAQEVDSELPDTPHISFHALSGILMP